MNKFALLALIVLFAGVSACGKSGEKETPQTSKQTVAVAPSAPSGISTLSSDGQVIVKWNPIVGADSYVIYIGDKGSQPLGQMNRVSGLKDASYEHKGLKNGSVYFYRVAAVSNAGEGTASPETNAMPKLVAPTQPNGVAAAGGTGKITLKWTPVAGADSYNIYYSTAPQQDKSKRKAISGIKNPPYDHADVKKKTMYFYVVSAVNGGGESPLSAESGAMP